MKIITVTTKGQMVIPSEIRKKLAINPGVKLNIEIIDSKIVLSVSDMKARLSTFRKKVRQNINSQKIIKISDEQINLAKSNLWKQRES